MVRKIQRRGRTVFVIDFADDRVPGGRYRRDAQAVTMSAAKLEEKAILYGLNATGRLVLPERAVAVAEPEPEPEPEAGELTFERFWTEHYSPVVMPGFKAATRESYRSVWTRPEVGLRTLVGAKVMATMPNADILKARNLIAASKRSARPAMILLKSMYKHAAVLELIERRVMPAALYREPEKLPESIEPEVAKMVLETAEGWLRRALILSLYCGLRMGEVRALRRKDIDLMRALVFVRQAYSENELSDVKTDRQRSVPLGDEPLGLLRESLREWGRGDEALVVAKDDGSPHRRQNVLSTFKRHLKRIGLQERAYHLTRHFFVTELVASGVDAETGRALSGHQSMSAFERYAHTQNARKRDAVAKISLGLGDSSAR